MAAVMRMDAEATAFEYAEQRLTEWGVACGNAGAAVGLSKKQSTIERIAEQRHILEGAHREFKREIRRVTRIGRGRKVKQLEPRRMRCLGCRKWFRSQRTCTHCGRDALTADGKPSITFKLPSFGLSSAVVEIESIVNILPRWMRAILRRTYLCGESDSFAADGLKIREAEFTHRRRCAVQRVADRLERRYSRPRSTSTVRSGE